MALNLLVVGGGGVRSTEVINQNVCGRFFNSRVTGQHLLVLETVVKTSLQGAMMDYSWHSSLLREHSAVSTCLKGKQHRILP